jgi:DNA-binding XRE family transcriptional regulator
MTHEGLAFKVKVDRSCMGSVERGEKNPTLLRFTKNSKNIESKNLRSILI